MIKNIKVYQQSIKKNILSIKSILGALRIKNQPPVFLYENMLHRSSDRIVSKWLSEEKYCRTYFVQKAFQGLYPEKYTRILLTIDAMVNILDDLLDESLDEKEKSEYVIEFLRVFSIYNNECPSKKILKFLDEYFNKLITIAMAENFYRQRIAKEKNFNKIVLDSADLLICRGMDIDVFVEITLFGRKDKNTISAIEKISRIFRAINILKKDIKDIPHDRKNNIKTIVILILSRNKDDFTAYINSLLNLFLDKSESVIKSIKKLKEKSLYSASVYRFNEMVREEKKEILRLIKFL